LTILCGVSVPESFNGLGIFSIDYPPTDTQRPGILVMFERAHRRSVTFEQVLNNEHIGCDLIAAMHFDNGITNLLGGSPGSVSR